MRVYNFSAGPATLPLEVLEQAQKEFLDYNGTGMSITEMSHRSKAFMALNEEARVLLRELMKIPDGYDVLFVQGGASQQFAAVPLNLMKTGKADYILTGNFAEKAYEEACLYGDAAIVASSKDRGYTCIPDIEKISFREETDYVHITSNNTIFGTRYTAFPKTTAPLVADMSSHILSEEIDVSLFGLIYAGAQKNIAPAGLTIVIVRKDLEENFSPCLPCPTMLRYSTYIENGSMFNTPPTFGIYMLALVTDWLKEKGGVAAIEKINNEKAQYLYSFLENSTFFKSPVAKADRSRMNVVFRTPSEELDAKFVKEAKENGLTDLKGHRLVGGCRASIYNAMPMEGVKALVEFMKKFELENK